MPLYLNHSLFFIHIPKCAGTTIEKALGMQKEEFFFSKNRFNTLFKVSPQHFTYKNLKIICNLDKFKLFTVVRNPYDRIVSEYKYIQNEENEYWEDFKNINFDSFIEKIFLLDELKRWCLFDSHFDLQYNFIEDGENLIKLFKYENLQEAFDWLNSLTDSTITFPHERNSEKMHYSFYYKYKKTIDIVSEFYKKDLEYFNYSFEMTDK
jgi:hypothetical protein